MKQPSYNTMNIIKKISKTLIVTVFFITNIFLFATKTFAQETKPIQIESLNVVIKLNKDTSVTVTETQKVNFLTKQKEYIRTLPSIYNGIVAYNNSTEIEVQSVEDLQGKSYNFTVSKLPLGSTKITIVDENGFLKHRTFVITYKVAYIINVGDRYDYLEWDLVNGIDGDVKTVDAQVISPYAAIIDRNCFAGKKDSQDKFCQSEFDTQKASFLSTQSFAGDKYFPIMIGVSKDNVLVYPESQDKLSSFIVNKWPFIVVFVIVSIAIWLTFRYIMRGKKIIVRIKRRKAVDTS